MENGKTFHPNKRNQGNARSTDYPAFRSRLDEWIKTEGSINRFAKKIGVTPRLVQKWRNGSFDKEKGCDYFTMPTAATLIRIAEVYGCSVDYVLGLSDCTTIENAEISKITGLTEKSIRYLRKSTGKRLSDVLNFILQKAYHNAGEAHLLELISAYLDFDEDNPKNKNKLCLWGEDGHNIDIPINSSVILTMITATLSEYRRLFQKQKGKP